MRDWIPGDQTKITDPKSAYYGEIGVVERLGTTGGLYVRHKNGAIVYHPWGFDIVRSTPVTRPGSPAQEEK